jgi:hypothetical protein
MSGAVLLPIIDWQEFVSWWGSGGGGGGGDSMLKREELDKRLQISEQRGRGNARQETETNCNISNGTNKLLLI